MINTPTHIRLLSRSSRKLGEMMVVEDWRRGAMVDLLMSKLLISLSPTCLNSQSQGIELSEGDMAEQKSIDNNNNDKSPEAWFRYRDELALEKAAAAAASCHDDDVDALGRPKKKLKVHQETTSTQKEKNSHTTQVWQRMLIRNTGNDLLKPKDWMNYLIFRQDWNKYRDSFYNRCQSLADKENDFTMKQRLVTLDAQVKRVDDEMEKHAELLKQVVECPMDINAIVRDFTEKFFRYLNVVQQTHDSLEDRDAIARLSARCLSAVSAYDNTLETIDTLDEAPQLRMSLVKISQHQNGLKVTEHLMPSKEWEDVFLAGFSNLVT